jgi:hypothetical protein
VKAGVVPGEFFEAIESGVKEALDIGILAGFPVINVQVTLIGGSYQDEDSTELAYKIAAAQAFKKSFSLFEKRGDPFSVIFGLVEQGLHFRLHLNDVCQAGLKGYVQELLGHSDRPGRAPAQAVGPLPGGLPEFIRGTTWLTRPRLQLLSRG